MLAYHSKTTNVVSRALRVKSKFIQHLETEKSSRVALFVNKKRNHTLN